MHPDESPTPLAPNALPTADETDNADTSAIAPNASLADAAAQGEAETAAPEEIAPSGSKTSGDDNPADDRQRRLESEIERLVTAIAALESQKQGLEFEIEALQGKKTQMLDAQAEEIRAALEQMLKAGLQELEQRQQERQLEIEQLERRRDRIREEMQTTFAGASQELAIRVQGFKDYLVGSLQDLALAAEQLDLVPAQQEIEPKADPIARRRQEPEPEEVPPTRQFAEGVFQEQTREIRAMLDRYRTQPDYYGPPWQLRRTFEPIHAQRVREWFFSSGGRGAVRSLGSRLQNIIIAAATISVLRRFYDDRLRTLVLANTPERLGEWRRGLQDCLGISRSDFGPERGATLFEDPDALAQKADRIVERQDIPLIIIDETEEFVSLALLQFPFWLAFAPDPQSMRFEKEDDDFDFSF